MASQDINFKMKPSVAFDSAVISSDTTTAGNIIDMNDGTNDFEALELMLVISAFTDGSYTLLLEEADLVGGPFTAVVAEDILGTNTALVAVDTVSHIGYVGKKQFVRVSIVSTGTTSGATLQAFAIQDRPRSAPLS